MNLAAPAGIAQVPAQVTIAAGATSANFTVIGGIKAGVEELAGHSRRFRVTKLPSRACRWPRRRNSRCGKQLSNPFSGTVAVQLTDANGLPYPGARIVAAATSGSVTPAIAAADAAGRPVSNGLPDGRVNQLSSRVEAAPAVTLTLNAGSAVPVIGAVVNAASFVAGYRTRLAGHALRRQSGRRQRLLNGIDVRPFYASDTQVNFYIPAETPARRTVITVTAPSGIAGLLHASTWSPCSPAFSAERWCTPTPE